MPHGPYGGAHMFMEFQLTASVFTTILRNRLRATPLCLDHEFEVMNTTYVLDRIDVEDGTSLQRERRMDRSSGTPIEVEAATNTVGIITPKGMLYDFTAAFLQVRQPLTIHLVTPSDLRTNAEQPSPSVPVPIVLVFNVDLWAPNRTQGGGRPALNYSIGYIDYGVYDSFIPDDDKAAIEQVVGDFAPQPVEMDLSALSGAIGAGGNAAGAVNCGIVCDRAATRVAMRIDFQVNGVRSGSVTKAFFEQDPADLLRGKQWAIALDKNVIVESVQQRIRGPLSSSTKFKLLSGPVASWQPAQCAVRIHAGLELFDACPFFVDDIDMDVDIDVTASLQVSQNQLTTNVNITGGPSDLGETILCAVTGSLLWPFLGPILLKEEELGNGLGFYFLGLATAPVVPFIGIMAAIYSQPIPDMKEDLGDNAEKVDDENYKTVETLDVRMPLSPPIQQRLNFETVYGTNDLLVFAGTISNLSELPMGTTSVDPSQLGWFIDGNCRAGGYRIAALSTITVNGSMDAPLCFGRIIDDPLGEYSIAGVGNEIVVRENFRPEFVALPDRYPCQVRVVTRRGVRTITYPPVDPITDAERARLEGMRRSFNKMCQAWRDSFHLPELVGVPRPQPMEHPDWTFWQIAVHGLLAGDEVTVSTPNGALLATLSAAKTGVAFTSFLLATNDVDQLQLSMKPVDDARRRPSITARQMHFARRAELPVQGELRNLLFERDGRRQLLILQDDHGTAHIDTTVARQSLVVHNETLSDIETVSEHPTFRVGTGKRITTVASDVLESSIQPLGFALPTDTAASFDAVSSPRIGSVSQSLYVRNADLTVVYDVADSAAPRVAQRLSSPAWFENAILGGNQLARYDRDGNVVRIYHCVGVAADGRMTWFTRSNDLSADRRSGRQ